MAENSSDVILIDENELNKEKQGEDDITFLSYFDYLNKLLEAKSVTHMPNDIFPSLKETILYYTCYLFENMFKFDEKPLYFLDIVIINRCYVNIVKFIYKSFTEDGDVTQNGSSLTQNGSSLTQNGSSLTQNGSSLTQNGSSLTQNGSSADNKDIWSNFINSLTGKILLFYKKLYEEVNNEVAPKKIMKYFETTSEIVLEHVCRINREEPNCFKYFSKYDKKLIPGLWWIYVDIFMTYYENVCYDKKSA